MGSLFEIWQTIEGELVLREEDRDARPPALYDVVLKRDDEILHIWLGYNRRGAEQMVDYLERHGHVEYLGHVHGPGGVLEIVHSKGCRCGECWPPRGERLRRIMRTRKFDPERGTPAVYAGRPGDLLMIFRAALAELEVIEGRVERAFLHHEPIVVEEDVRAVADVVRGFLGAWRG